MNHPITLVLDNLRSAQNVGSILRTADAAGVKVVTCGYTPHPITQNDSRPPHIAASNTKAIAKTALGAENTAFDQHFSDVQDAISYLRHKNFTIVALEQHESSKNVFTYQVTCPLGIVLGNEVTGVPPVTLSICDNILELPMIGSKESLNVSVAAGIAVYQLRFGQHHL